jgi:hypothetical protein
MTLESESKQLQVKNISFEIKPFCGSSSCSSEYKIEDPNIPDGALSIKADSFALKLLGAAKLPYAKGALLVTGEISINSGMYAFFPPPIDIVMGIYGMNFQRQIFDLGRR